MSAVILRCDNCGTAHTVPGPCPACHEGSVRYFCKNHNPGRWLDTPKCPDCQAEYGVAITAPKRPPLEERRDRADTGISPSDRPTPRASPPKRVGRPWGTRPSPSSDKTAVSDEVMARARALEKLRRLLVGGSYGRRTPEPTEFIYPSPAPMIAGGCLRIMFLMMLVFLLISFLGLANFGSFFVSY